MKTTSALSVVAALGLSLGLAGCSSSKTSSTPQGPAPHHRVGGHVTGLAGTGLVLRNNGGDDLDVAADGAFTFATSLATGVSYAVTVHRQPSAPVQACTVTGGTGRVGSADVTTVTVTCVTPPAPTRYTVGGTVSGLVGTGLVLQNGGGDDLAIAGDGAFTFATSIVQGAAYAVTVLHQPAGPAQTCSVGAGAGVMPAANVSSVVVTCSAPAVPRHLVGGTVTGLAGSTGLVLRNDGGDDLAVDADGAFHFVTSVAEGGAYDVSVFQDPTPALTCAVAGGTGVVGTGDVTTVVVDCRGWHASELVEFSTTLDASYPAVASDASGNLMVVWGATDVSQSQGFVFARRWVYPTGWEPEVLVAAGDAGSRPTAFARVVVDGAGNAFAAFLLNSGGRTALHTATYTVAGGWTAPARLDAAQTGDAAQSAFGLALGPSGGATVAWTENSGYGTKARVLSSSAPSGGAFGAVYRLDSADADAYGPQVAHDATGKVTVVWTQALGSGNHYAWVNERASGGTWDATQAARLNPAGGAANSFEVQLAYDGLGTAHVAWVQSNGAVMTVRRPASASWLDPMALATATSYGAGGPRIAGDAAGNATLLWWHQASGGGGAKVGAARFDGSGWSGPSFISAGAASDGIGEIGMAVDGAGDVYAAWTQGPINPGTASLVWVTRFLAGSAWEAPLQLAGTAGSWAPALAAHDGHALAVWFQSHSGTTPPYDIRASRY